MAFESDLNDVRFANPMSARTPRPASGDSATFDSEQGSVEVTPKTPPTREQAVAGETSFANPAVVDKKGSARMRRPVHECEIREDENSRTWSPDFFALLSDALQRIVAQWDPVTELFGEIDADGDGELDVGEVRQLLGQKLSRTEIKVAFQQMDRDGSGAVDIEEFRGWWDTNVVDPNGAFNKHLSQISRKEIQQEMHKLFQKTHSLDASPNPEAGGRTHCPDFDEPLPADTFYTLLEETLCFTLSADDRRHMTEQLEVAALTAWEESMKGGRAPEGSAHSITAFLRLWDHFFEFDERDPVKEALETLSSSYLLSPFSRFRQDWDVAQSLLLVYVGIAVPYRIGFSDHVRLWSFFFWLDLLVDLYFITDIFVNLRTAVLAKNGAIIYKSREIFKVYLKGWLLIDVTSCLPFGYMQYASSDHSTNSSRMVRLLRLLKLLRLTRITSMLERWEEALYSVRHLKLLLVLVCLFGAAHAIACAWAYVGTTAGTVLPDGTTMHGWVIDKYHDWEKVGSGTLYADAFTWASSAALMVGSGEWLHARLCCEWLHAQDRVCGRNNH
jgi:Ca2+-binding EF-hand superfamily protein